MEKRRFEKMLEQLMKQDLAAETEEFRDTLLARCLDVLGSDDQAADDVSEGIELDDSYLDLLAAAGDLSALDGVPGSDDNQ